LNAIFAVTVIVTPTYIYTGIFLYYLFIAAATCCLGLYVTFKAAMKKKPEAYFFIAGLLLLVAGACIDTMVFLQMIKTGYMLSVGMCGFIICQAALLARKHSYAYTEVEKLSEDLKDSIDKVIKTETAYLNAQMKPHFLYNALNTIASFCETNSKEAGKLIIALSKYLRGTLDFDNMKSIVPLRKELEIVYAYVALEQARFEDIKVEFHIDESLLDFGIPPLTIQPLVENAIKYGLQQNGNKGVVKVTIEKTDNYVSVCVEDDGTGLPEEKMRRLLNAPIGSASIGLYNINTRLVRAYGKGLMINSSRGKGAILCFKIPIMEDVLDG
ncbi:MAG: histidine kinase, partial [Clostridiales bacterium]|nr:histidine kinase [Clostridiales bacterium]